MPFLISPNTPANQNLWRAVWQGDRAAARDALQEGADANLVWKGHTCVLLQAVLQRNEAMACLLLDAGAWAWRPGLAAHGRIPIHEATAMGLTSVVRRMLGAREGEHLPILSTEHWLCLFRRSMWSEAGFLDELLESPPVELARPTEALGRARTWARISHVPRNFPSHVFERLDALPGMAFPRREECIARTWRLLAKSSLEGHPWVESTFLARCRAGDLFSQDAATGENSAMAMVMEKNTYFLPHDKISRILGWLKDADQGPALLKQHRDVLLAASARAGSIRRMQDLAKALGMPEQDIARSRAGGKPLVNLVARHREDPVNRARLISWLVARGAEPGEADDEGNSALETQCEQVEPREAIVRALLDAGCPWTDKASGRLRASNPELSARIDAERMAAAVPGARTMPGARARM